MKSKKHLGFGSLRDGLSSCFRDLSDKRQASKTDYSIDDALMSGFACMYFQDPSLLQFQQRLKEDQQRDNLQTLFGVENIPESTQLRDIVDEVNSKELRPIFADYFYSLQRGKHLDQYQLFPGLYLCSQVIPLMPEEICNTDGTTKQDCEVNAAKRLIPQIRKDHPQLGIIICGDDLFSRQPFIKKVACQPL